MEVTKPTLGELFGQHRRFTVPMYQRQYVWSADDHWSYLWDDIKRKTEQLLIGENREPIANHFMGALVLLPGHAAGQRLSFKEVIDGQQRLTTMQVILIALRDLAEALSISDVAADLRRVTLNEGRMENPEVEKWKVWPTESDQVTFQRVVSAGTRDEVSGRFPVRGKGRRRTPPDGIPGAYLYFYDAMQNFVTRLSDDDENPVELTLEDRCRRVNELLTALQNYFQFVCIDLERNDDPQVIFEALNGRGAPLLPSDLIKNFVFQTTRQAGGQITQMYEQYWRQFDDRRVEDEDEQNGEAPRFWKVEEKQGRLTRPRIDLFLFHFLQCKRRNEVLITELFREFKDWWSATPAANIAALTPRLANLKVESDIFAEFFVPNLRTVTGYHIGNLRSLDTSTIYPLLLLLLGEARRNGQLAIEEIPSILKHIESYLVRRFVCNLTPKKYNYVFMQLLKNLCDENGVIQGEINADRIRHELTSHTGLTVEWPSDDAFRSSWLTMPIYAAGRATTIKMILSAIDRARFGEAIENIQVNYENLWIEHVMPQKWKQHWPLPEVAAPQAETDNDDMLDSEERRNVLLHTFGNLTLLTKKLNQSVRNSAYFTKKSEITRWSALQLNVYFQNINEWDEARIETRGLDLFQTALQLWPR